MKVWCLITFFVIQSCILAKYSAYGESGGDNIVSLYLKGFKKAPSQNWEYEVSYLVSKFDLDLSSNATKWNDKSGAASQAATNLLLKCREWNVFVHLTALSEENASLMVIPQDSNGTEYLAALGLPLPLGLNIILAASTAAGNSATTDTLNQGMPSDWREELLSRGPQSIIREHLHHWRSALSSTDSIATKSAKECAGSIIVFLTSEVCDTSDDDKTGHGVDELRHLCNCSGTGSDSCHPQVVDQLFHSTHHVLTRQQNYTSLTPTPVNLSSLCASQSGSLTTNTTIQPSFPDFPSDNLQYFHSPWRYRNLFRSHVDGNTSKPKNALAEGVAQFLTGAGLSLWRHANHLPFGSCAMSAAEKGKGEMSRDDGIATGKSLSSSPVCEALRFDGSVKSVTLSLYGQGVQNSSQVLHTSVLIGGMSLLTDFEKSSKLVPNNLLTNKISQNRSGQNTYSCTDNMDSKHCTNGGNAEELLRQLIQEFNIIISGQGAHRQMNIVVHFDTNPASAISIRNMSCSLKFLFVLPSEAFIDNDEIQRFNSKFPFYLSDISPALPHSLKLSDMRVFPLHNNDIEKPSSKASPSVFLLDLSLTLENKQSKSTTATKDFTLPPIPIHLRYQPPYTSGQVNTLPSLGDTILALPHIFYTCESHTAVGNETHRHAYKFVEDDFASFVTSNFEDSCLKKWNEAQYRQLPIKVRFLGLPSHSSEVSKQHANGIFEGPLCFDIECQNGFNLYRLTFPFGSDSHLTFAAVGSLSVALIGMIVILFAPAAIRSLRKGKGIPLDKKTQ